MGKKCVLMRGLCYISRFERSLQVTIEFVLVDAGDMVDL